MANPRVLILNDHPALCARLTEVLRKTAPELNLEGVRRVTEVLAKVAQDPYDALICVADSEDELSVVVRVRKKNPDLPIVLIADVQDSNLREQARRLGVDEIADGKSDPHELIETVRRALATKRLAAEALQESGRSRVLAREVLDLASEARRLIQAAGETVKQYSYSRFVPLLVEDEPDPAFQMIQAFAKAGMPFPLPVMKSPDEAIAYLTGAGPFADRLKFPLPTLILLSGKSTLELLRWIREESPRRLLPVVIIGSSKDPEDRRKAYELGANSFLARPADPPELVNVVRSLGVYWTSFNLGFEV